MSLGIENDKFACWEITDIRIHIQTLLHKRNLGNAKGQMPHQYFFCLRILFCD